jgi:hypothetical protein
MSAAGAAGSAAVNSDAITTLSLALKEKMMLMPDELDTKKEIDEFYKNVMKELAAVKKLNKPAKAAKTAKPAKPAKPEVKAKKPAKKNLDENGEEKPKRPLTKYQLFLKEWQPKIKEAHPELSNTERFAKIAEEWQKHKADAADANAVAAVSGEADEADESDEADEADEADESGSVDEPEPEPKPVVKKAKKVNIVEEVKVVVSVLDEVTPPSSEELVEPEPVKPAAEPVEKKKKVRKAIVKKDVVSVAPA